MNQLRTEAERLRDQGYSYNMITEALGISKSTMSYWFREKSFTPNEKVAERANLNRIALGARRHNRKVIEIANMRALGIKEIGTLSRRDLWMLGLGLYIGEGAKTVETLRVANSNPAVILVIIRWFKECCGLSEENIIIHLHLYPDNNIDESLRYWGEITGLPRENFRKTQLDRRTTKKRSRRGTLPHGTAHLRVVCRGNSEKGVALYRKVEGWMAGALQQV